MTAAARAGNGAAKVVAKALKTIRRSGPPAIASPMLPRIKVATPAIRLAESTAPKTGQPKPATNPRERVKAAERSRRSITIAGASTAQIVIRMQPGTTNRMRPANSPMAARTLAITRVVNTGPTEPISSPTDGWLPPSRVRCTRLTTIPW